MQALLSDDGPEGLQVELVTSNGSLQATLGASSSSSSPTVVQGAGPYFIPETSTGFVEATATVPALAGGSWAGVQAFWPNFGGGGLAILDAWFDDASTGDVTIRFLADSWPGSSGQSFNLVAWPTPPVT